ncbi:MAG: heavy-metal-associated domain-containing protein [Gammaproteobacteria bacterium]|nr:heavy-metal-associated domain-containing protein [Gammaproteobacteria bacterium]
MKRLFFLLTLLLFTSQSLAEDVHYHLVVSGLSCPFCVYGVEKKLKNLEGVVEIKSELETGRFFVQVEDGVSLSKEMITELVTSAGFTLVTFEEITLED